MEKIRLLLVEDDDNFSFIIKGSLELTGSYEVCTAGNGKEGLEKYETFKPDIIVADIEMPVMSGMEMVSSIRREDTQIPIFYATAKTSPKDLIEGYKSGIDNYIRKPYLPEELDMHIKAVLKRANAATTDNHTSNTIFKIGKYLFNSHTGTLQRQDTAIRLTGREVQILLLLYRQKGQIVERNDLLNQCWGENTFYTSRSLDVFINKIRKAFKEDPTIEIKTIRGKGLVLYTR